MKRIISLINGRKYLYHYTTFCTGVRILSSMSLRFHKLKDMNDINELYRPLWFIETDINTCNLQKKAKREIDLFQQISFVQDKGKRKGFDIPAMWGHYGDAGNGVCIILDKEKLINSLPKEIYRHPISYQDDFSPDIFIDNKKTSDFVFSKKEIKECFFKKTKDWSYEQEYRLLQKSEDDNLLELNIDGAFVAVILHRDKLKQDSPVFCSDNFQILSKIVGKERILAYENGLSQRALVNINRESEWSSVEWDKFELDV